MLKPHCLGLNKEIVEILVSIVLSIHNASCNRIGNNSRYGGIMKAFGTEFDEEMPLKCRR
jgi:hypothetical protein